jgi:hypothetical protein
VGEWNPYPANTMAHAWFELNMAGLRLFADVIRALGVDRLADWMAARV